jgi:hypothetical protein
LRRVYRTKVNAPLFPPNNRGLSGCDVSFPFWDEMQKKFRAISIGYC